MLWHATITNKSNKVSSLERRNRAKYSYMKDLSHVMASILCTAVAVLNTRLEKKNELTATFRTEDSVVDSWIWSTEAVTAERKVAIVVSWRRRFVSVS